MKQLIITIFCILLYVLSYSQQINRTNGSVLINDPKLKASQAFYIPVGETPTLNGAPDSIGALFYNTTDRKLYKYNEDGWDIVGKVAYFNNFSDFTSYLPSTDELCILSDNVYGGGIFIAVNNEEITIDNGMYFETGNESLAWARKVKDPKSVNINWFGYTDDLSATIKKAVIYLSTLGGGEIYLPAGTYTTSVGITIDSDNIRVVGAGQGATTILGSFQPNTHYRYGDWLSNSGTRMLTYDDTQVAVGRGYIDLRVSTDADSLKAGDKIFINAGSSHYDQNYGEFNIVDSIIGSRVYLRYNMVRNYNQPYSSWAATITSIFTPPAEGATATVFFSGDAPAPSIDGPVSIGNDLYQVVSYTSNSAVVRNMTGKGNQTANFPIGTHMYKWRAIVRTPTTPYNTFLKDLTIEAGGTHVLILSNSMKTTLENVTINYTGSGNWGDGDDGRDFTMSDCEVHSKILSKAQWARSFADIRLFRNKFFNAALEFSEFNSNVDVYNNQINGRYSGFTGESNLALILLGNTCNNIRIHNNEIYASNISSVFGNGEIQVFNAVGSTNFYIDHNIIRCDNVGVVFLTGGFANTIISDNTITGKTNIIFESGASQFLSTDVKYAAGGQFGFGSRCLIKDNFFSGYVDAFSGYGNNLELINNYVNRFGASSASNEFDSWGNVLYTHFTEPDSVENFVFKDNTFKGWNLRSNSFPSGWFDLEKRGTICNIRFFDMVGTYSSVQDSVVNILCPEGIGNTTITNVLTDINESITNISDNLPELNANWVALGEGIGVPGIKGDTLFYYNTSTKQLRINSLTSIYRITAKGSTFWKYYSTPGELFQLDSMAFTLTSGFSDRSVSIPMPVNSGYAKYITIDQPNMQFLLHNGNTDGSGAGFSRPGVGNFSEMRFWSGRTQDNNFFPRQGYFTWYTGNEAGTLIYRAQLDSSGNFILATGQLRLPSTISGTTGDQTIDEASGKVIFAAAASSITVTNSLVTTNSIVHVQVEGTDATAKTATVTLSTGSFIITLNAAATANTKVSFVIIGKSN